MISQMLEKDLHGRIITKATILLIKAEVGRMKVDNQRRWFALEFLKNILGSSDFAQLAITLDTKPALHACIPCGSDSFFFGALESPVRPSATEFLPLTLKRLGRVDSRLLRRAWTGRAVAIEVMVIREQLASGGKAAAYAIRSSMVR